MLNWRLLLLVLAGWWAAGGFPTSVSAGNLERGLEAFAAGEHSEARDLLKPYAEKGHGGAMGCLGRIYFEEGGREFERAAEWLEKAAELGDLEACGPLGFIYAFGAGETGFLAPDLPLACQYWTIAASSASDVVAGHFLAELTARMKPEEVEAATARAREWLDRNREKAEAWQRAVAEERVFLETYGRPLLQALGELEKIRGPVTESRDLSMYNVMLFPPSEQREAHRKNQSKLDRILKEMDEVQTRLSRDHETLFATFRSWKDAGEASPEARIASLVRDDLALFDSRKPGWKAD